MVTFKGANLITVTFQTKPHWPPGHRELAFLRTFNFHATTGAGGGDARRGPIHARAGLLASGRSSGFPREPLRRYFVG